MSGGGGEGEDMYVSYGSAAYPRNSQNKTANGSSHEN